MADARDEGDPDIEIAADVVVEPEPVNPNEAAKQALRAAKVKADPSPTRKPSTKKESACLKR